MNVGESICGFKVRFGVKLTIFYHEDDVAMDVPVGTLTDVTVDVVIDVL